MNEPTSVQTRARRVPSRRVASSDLSQAYMQLQRLRKLVDEAETCAANNKPRSVSRRTETGNWSGAHATAE